MEAGGASKKLHNKSWKKIFRWAIARIEATTPVKVFVRWACAGVIANSRTTDDWKTIVDGSQEKTLQKIEGPSLAY